MSRSPAFPVGPLSLSRNHLALRETAEVGKDTICGQKATNLRLPAKIQRNRRRIYFTYSAHPNIANRTAFAHNPLCHNTFP